MKLYFSPLACSMASRISVYEADAPATFIEVNGKTKRTLNGESFLSINPLGLVPTLQTDEGQFLTENAAILQFLSDRYPSATLAPTSGFERAQLQQWLCFIGTELHKASFAPLLDPKSPEGAKLYALEKAKPRLEYLNNALEGREFLLTRFSVADAYLFVVLNWTVVTPIKLQDYPALDAYVTRLRTRPSIAKAFAEERELYVKEQSRHHAA